MSPASPSPAIPYGASQQDLFYPAHDLSSFPTVLPKTDAELCAWMCLLAYCDGEPGTFAFDQPTITSKLKALGFTVQFFESVGHPKEGGTHCLLAIHDDPDPTKKLAVVAFRGRTRTIRQIFSTTWRCRWWTGRVRAKCLTAGRTHWAKSRTACFPRFSPSTISC